MRKLYALFIALGLALGVACAQTVTVSGSKVIDSAGATLGSGTITFAPVDASGHPLSFRMGGGGQVLSRPVTATVTTGEFSLSLPDTVLTNPVNVCFKATVVDNVTGDSILGTGYTCIQPSNQAGSAAVTAGWCTSGGACNFDNFIPNNTALPVQTINGQGGGTTFNGGTVTSTITAPTVVAGPASTVAIGTDSSNSAEGAVTFNGNFGNDTGVLIGSFNGSGQMNFGVPPGGEYTFRIGNTLVPNGCVGITNGSLTFGNTCSGGTSYTLPAATNAALGGVQLAYGVSGSTLAKIASSGAASDLSGLQTAVQALSLTQTNPFVAPSVSTNSAWNGGQLIEKSSSPAYPPAPPANSIIFPTIAPGFTSSQGVEFAFSNLPTTGNTILSCSVPASTAVTGGTALVSTCTFVASAGGGGGSTPTAASVTSYLAGGNESTNVAAFTTAENSSTGGPNFNMVAGNSLLLGITITSATNTITSVADLAGCTFAQIGTVQTIPAGGHHYWYLATNCTTGSSSDIVTVTQSAGGAYGAVSAYQISTGGSVLAFDTQPALVNVTATSVATASFNTANSYEVVACDGWNVGGTDYLTHGTGFTAGGGTVGGEYLNGEYQTFSTTQTGITGSFTFASSIPMDIACVAVGY